MWSLVRELTYAQLKILLATTSSSSSSSAAASSASASAATVRTTTTTATTVSGRTSRHVGRTIKSMIKTLRRVVNLQGIRIIFNMFIHLSLFV